METSKINQFLQISPVIPKHQKKKKENVQPQLNSNLKQQSLVLHESLGGAYHEAYPSKIYLFPNLIVEPILVLIPVFPIVELKLHIERVRLWSDSLPVIKYFRNENVNF